ncbi:MAG: cupin domain-containing protein [Caldilineales bacterium]|nr:cupin domain-containing protein [Caldilineales bacterium]
MLTAQLFDDLKFGDENPNAEPLYVDEFGRVIRFALRPGQTIREHRAPHSPFYVVVLKGQGVFTGADGADQRVGPNDLLVFDQGEIHSVRALDEDFIFVGFLHGAPAATSGKTGGALNRQ